MYVLCHVIYRTYNTFDINDGHIRINNYDTIRYIMYMYAYTHIEILEVLEYIN